MRTIIENIGPLPDVDMTHVGATELERLTQMSWGAVTYEVRLNGSGNPMRCKGDGCQNHAMQNARKQLCPTHYAGFLARSNRDLAKPSCRRCNVRTTHVFRGAPACRTCATATLAREAEEATQQIAEHVKHTQLDEVSTVEDLKDWIREHLL